MSGEDYWDDFESYDTTAEQLKESLVESVREEIKTKIASLEAENSELRGKLTNLEQLEEEARKQKSEAELAYSNATREARRARANEIMKAIEHPAYAVEREWTKGPKCNKCNEDRKLQFTYPSGKEGFESCECAKQLITYQVKQCIGTEAKISRWGGKNDLVIWYHAYYGGDSDHDDLISSSYSTAIYNGEKFDDLRPDTIFHDHGKAEEFAKYLNEKEEK